VVEASDQTEREATTSADQRQVRDRFATAGGHQAATYPNFTDPIWRCRPRPGKTAAATIWQVSAGKKSVNISIVNSNVFNSSVRYSYK